MPRGPQRQDQPAADLNKYLITLHFVHSWWGVNWHNANKLNNRNGIQNIQPKVSLKCMLPWSCPEQTTGEEGDMTAFLPPSLLQKTHRITAVASLLLWIPLATAVEKFSGEEGRGESWAKWGKIWELWVCMETNISKSFTLTESQEKERAAKSELLWANGGKMSNTEAFCSANSQIILYF